MLPILIDSILASLHTTDDRLFRERLGGQSVRKVMENIAALSAHGYRIDLNYSLGPYNQHEFGDVLDFAIAHELFLKAIAFVRPNEGKDFYDGEWVDPDWIAGLLRSRGAIEGETRASFGGTTTTWSMGQSAIKVKNVARGRLETDFCAGCPHKRACGEGIYGVRVGVDGLWKPCLLRRERFTKVQARESYALQILRIIDAMIGNWNRARYRCGAPV
jgi:molybdenum cofactor biosynthesis enzyme MoaA